MPNWCYTQFIFRGNKTEIEDFHAKIIEWTSHGNPRSGCSGFGPKWLGNILYGVGLEDRIDADEDRIRCRGTLNYIDDVEVLSYDEATFYIDTETAWVPMGIMWRETIAALKYETIGFSYMAEEPGCELYEIYDPYGDFVEEYRVDMYLEGDDVDDAKLQKFRNIDYYPTSDELKIALKELLNSEDDDVFNLICAVEKYPFKDSKSYICIGKYARIKELCE
jgi:hypothetical protein